METTSQANWIKRSARAIVEVFYGMAFHDMVRFQTRERGYLERLFILTTFGDIVGIPVLPPYYNLKLLPFIVPHINAWRRSMLRERDITDLIG
jgi:hypothetical protein